MPSTQLILCCIFNVVTCFDVKVSSSGLWYKIHKQKYIYIYTYLLLERLTTSQLVTKFPHFMEPEGSLPHLQVPATCPCPQTDQSSWKEIYIYTTVIMFRIEILILLVKIHVAVSIKLHKINTCDKVKEGYLIVLKCSWINVLQVCFMLGWLSWVCFASFWKVGCRHQCLDGTGIFKRVVCSTVQKTLTYWLNERPTDQLTDRPTNQPTKQASQTTNAVIIAANNTS
jgi:hypothetical protein